jgi:SanA protein
VRRRRRVLRWAAGVVAAVALVVLALNVLVLREGRGGVDDVARIDHAPVAIVLGAAVLPDGRMSAMLADRVRQGLALYRAGKVDKLLVSGDHGAWRYDETGTMRRALVRAGVPPRDVFTDHAGFDTRATMERARRVFGVRRAVVVTQGFHMSRALYLARRAGLDVQGLTSDLEPYRTGAGNAREVLARVKAVWNVATGARVLGGPSHPITGDGRGSWGPPTPPAPATPSAAATPPAPSALPAPPAAATPLDPPGPADSSGAAR